MPRRQWASAGVAAAGAALAAGVPDAVEADGSAPNTPREALADFASKLPGYGASDVWYPEWFRGDWQATTELSAVEAPRGDASAGEAALKARRGIGTQAAVEQYPQRYIDYRGHVIADRAYNVRGLVRSSGGFESVDWDPSNPNSLTVVTKRDGLSVQTLLKVTKRASASPEGYEADRFNATEFFQEVVSSGGVQAPRVTPVRCVNKFRRDGERILVVQRVEVFTTPGSPDDPSSVGDAILSGNSDKPVTIYRYRGILERPRSKAPEQEPRAL